ncbi:MAG: hypothetical protein R3B40_03630 [Polyangiales bacterium]
MPVWGSWSLFFAVSVACLLLARRLDRSPETPSREAEGAHRPSLPDAVMGTPPPPRSTAEANASALSADAARDRPSRQAR